MDIKDIVMTDSRFGFVAGHLVEYSDCTCGSGGFSPHEQYCGVEPVMTMEDLTAFLDAPIVGNADASADAWTTAPGSENSCGVYVSTACDVVVAHADGDWFSPTEARAYALALLFAANVLEARQRASASKEDSSK